MFTYLYIVIRNETKQDSFDNKSDKWQESEKGEEMQRTINDLEEAYDKADCLLEQLCDLFPEE